MLNTDNFKGVFPALISPLTPEQTLDGKALEILIQRMVNSGVNGIVILGSSGEGPILPISIQEEMMERAVTIVAGRIPVASGISGLNTSESIKKSKIVKSIGAEGILLLPPFYYPLPQKEVIDYYQCVADQSELPVIIYNIPALTKVAISPEAVAVLSRHPNIIGLKDSSGNFIAFQNMIYAAAGQNFNLVQGAAPLTLAGMFMGAQGWISPVGNVDPQLEVSLYSAWSKGDLITAQKLQKKMNNWAKIMNYNGRPVALNAKAVLFLMGLCHNIVLSPSLALSEDELKNLKKFVKDLGLIDIFDQEKVIS